MTNSGPQFVFTLPPQAPESSSSPSTRRFPRAALWLVGIGLCANAAILISRGQVPDIVLDRAALAQSTPASGQLLGARGIYMMPAQLGPNAWGLYLMDVDSGTICVYKASPETSHFRLMAARSYKYDRFLEDFNNEPLRPKDVQKLIDDQRQRTDLHQKDDQPTVVQTPRPDENLPDQPKESTKSPDQPKDPGKEK